MKYFGIVALNPEAAFLGGIEAAEDDLPAKTRKTIEDTLEANAPDKFTDGLILVELVPVDRIKRSIVYESVDPIVPTG